MSAYRMSLAIENREWYQQNENHKGLLLYNREMKCWSYGNADILTQLESVTKSYLVKKKIIQSAFDKRNGFLEKEEKV